MYQETFGQAWMARYGRAPEMEHPELAPFLRHRSVRKYDDRPVPESLMEALIACAQSAATSSNLQLWSVVSVQEPAQRATLTDLTGDQPQVANAPWFLCFLADHYRLRRAAEAHGESAAGLDYTEFMLMAALDATLAAERLVCAAEHVGLGICYIGGLRNHPEAVREALNLPTGVVGLFDLCLGYPDETAHAEIKPRLAPESVWFREQYNRDVTAAEYDARMTAFYESQTMKGDVTWSMRSARRVDGNHMTGREVWKDWLERNQMGVR